MTGIVVCSHVYEASDLLLVLSPREDSFCRDQADPVWSCHVWFYRWALNILKDRQGWFDVTNNNRHRKSSFHTLCCRGGVFWSECLIVSKTSQSQGCELRAYWSSLTHCQNIHSSTLMYPHPLTHPNLCLWWIRSAKHLRWNLFKATSTFSTL